MYRIKHMASALLIALTIALPLAAQEKFTVDVWPDGFPNTNGRDLTQPYSDSTHNYRPRFRLFLPDRRGGLMDSPLVLTTRLDPNEIDKEAHNVDCRRYYPVEFYHAAMDMKDPKEVEKIMDLVCFLPEERKESLLRAVEVAINKGGIV